MHTWKTDLVLLGFQLLEEPAILSPLSSSNSHHPPPHVEPLRQKDKIKSDVPSSVSLFFLPRSHLAFAIQMWPGHVIQVAQSERESLLC